MSSLVIQPINRAIGFYAAPLGKKAVMAATGAVLFAYVVGHLFGNLQIYASDPDRINRYAAFLHDPANTVPLWAIRAFLAGCLLTHITASAQLWWQNRQARPERYHKKNDLPTAYAARTMVWSGPIIGAFVAFHVLHLTSGMVLPLQDVGGNPAAPDVRANVIAGFQHPVIAAVYIVAMGLLCLHLFHGLWSMFQSVGASHPRYTPKLKALAGICAIVILLGNISIPIAVLAGFLTN
jgi:succinate dehydrogenase / fumarate reductase, cytochrome b subunit